MRGSIDIRSTAQAGCFRSSDHPSNTGVAGAVPIRRLGTEMKPITNAAGPRPAFGIPRALNTWVKDGNGTAAIVGQRPPHRLTGPAIRVVR